MTDTPQTIPELYAVMDQRFKAIEKTMDNHFKAVNKCLGRIERSMNRQLATNTEAIAELTKRVDRLETAVFT